MAEFMRDQAEGLRRLFANDFVRAIAVAGGKGGIGKTHVVVNLAIAMANRGRRVLVLDGQFGPGGLEGALGIKPRYNLSHVIRGERALEEVLIQGPGGIAIIPAALGLPALAGLDAVAQDNLVHSFTRLSGSFDVMLMDAGSDSRQASFSLASQDVIIVVSGLHDSITDAYGLIKSLSRNFAKRHYHILVNKVDSFHEARAVFENMSQVAGRFLEVSLDFMGYVPYDDKLKQSAMLCRPVTEAFPSADASLAFRELAESVEQWPFPSDNDGRIESFMLRLIIGSRLSREVVNSSLN
ncbi:MAG: AAA family ATPase [Sulfuricella sp.]|nr:AAA family ATPase [Sulfuricella sp.]